MDVYETVEQEDIPVYAENAFGEGCIVTQEQMVSVQPVVLQQHSGSVSILSQG